MVVYKRGGSYWADFTVNGQRFRLPLKATNKQQAATVEKQRIAEAQSQGGFASRNGKTPRGRCGNC
jgi:hypothetical protein